jgi:hypothetical protein
MSKKPKHDDEDQRKTDEVLRRMLHTPPQPFTPMKKPKQRKKPAEK